ncbi:EF-hand domain-containing protein [Desulfocurvibacter africanus]|uniref:EF-hand domain-containing protein n=1 Tax=Desulfocurvibacter africanus TaxID=873 RepID=UPI002FD9681D
MKQIALIIGMLALFPITPAAAQVGSDWGSGGFEAYGTQEQDKSGEASGVVMEQDFETVDLNGDNMVTERELQQTYGAQVTQERSFAKMDRDSDGALSRYEYQREQGPGVGR